VGMGNVREAYVWMGAGVLLILLSLPLEWYAVTWVGATVAVAGFVRWQIAARRGTSRR